MKDTVLGIPLWVDPAVPAGNAYILGWDEDGNIKSVAVIRDTA